MTVLNSSQRSNTQIINSNISHSQQWILTVIANKTGNIKIPSIKFGKESSSEALINVVKASTKHGNVGNEDIILDIDVSTTSPYVQAQVIYTVKLYRSIVTSNATLTEPAVNAGQAIINKLGDDKSYEINRNGKRYVVIERRYVIFPQSSGELIIDPIIFQGQTGRSGLFGFDPFGPPPKSVVKRSDDIRLNVKPIPDSFTGKTWLPASELTIQEQWSIDPGKLKQGEATTRTLTLQAKGLAASQLPATNSNLPDSLKQYPDQPEFEDANNSEGYIGVRRDKMAIIPTEAGDHLLPAIKIPWWNTDTDKMEIAELPERSIHVKANPGVDSTKIPESDIRSEISTNTQNENDTGISDVIETSETSSNWKWISFALLVLWIITLFLWWRGKNQLERKTEINVENTNKRIAKRKINEACKANDPARTKEAILEWSRINWPNTNISNINAIKQFSEENFQRQLDLLSQHLYGKLNEPWNGEAFLKSFESQSFEIKKNTEPAGKLEPLYKT